MFMGSSSWWPSLQAHEECRRRRDDADRRQIAPIDGALRIEDEQRPFAEAVSRAVGMVGPELLALGLEGREQREADVPVFGDDLL
jgi:hypothetical protein